MKTARLPTDLATHFGCHQIAVAFGVFDGVHIGHRRILDRVCELAATHGAVPTVVTFEPHPRNLLSSMAPPLLTPLPQKLRLLEDCGIEATVLLPFDQAMAALPPNDFLETYVFTGERPRVTAICIGSEWRFGREGSGTVSDLRAIARLHDCRVESVSEVLQNGMPVSSTRIREAIQSGQLAEARSLLGRDIVISGTVKSGKGIGARRLNCPTANIEAGGGLLPPDGVYAARGLLQSRGQNLPGIAYIGKSPTVTPTHTAAPRIIEIHLFDIDEALYGEDIDITFVHFIRPDRKFAGEQQLKQQIAADITAARDLLNAI